MVLALLGLVASACTVVTTSMHDDRMDLNRRPNGTAVIIGDSVGYGMAVVGGESIRLALDGWGPVRSFTQLGIHARPETPTDPHTVVSWIRKLRADGFKPDVVVLVVGANDVGYAGGKTVAANADRIRQAMQAIGNVDVVWTTISHPTGQAAWNAALFTVAGERPNLHVCDWASVLAAKPWYLQRDKVHMTVGPGGGYTAMAEYVRGCVRAVKSSAPPPTTTTTATIPPTTSTTAPASTTTTGGQMLRAALSKRV